MKLSIITINYKNKAGLDKTMKSVLSQTWCDFEWIIIDGCSTDGSKELIQSTYDKIEQEVKDSLHKKTVMGRGFNPISYWCCEPDKGIFNAMNKGIAHASGEWINFMNSGDVFNTPDTLKDIFSKKYDCDVIYGDCYLDFSGKRELRRHHHPVDVFDLIAHPLCHQSMFYKTAILKGCEYDETLPYTADCVKNIELLTKGYKFQYIDDIVCVFDKTGVSSTSADSHNEEFHRGIKKHVPEYALDLVWRLHVYEDSHLQKQVNKVLNSSGFIRFMFRIILRIFSWNVYIKLY